MMKYSNMLLPRMFGALKRPLVIRLAGAATTRYVDVL